ncbi:MAG: hypothetical protein IKC32_07600 [Clostridia bacterium]|nr:hypothetical protein [Clostridia bacterium]
MVYNEFGELYVRASLADAALPVEGAKVIVRGADEYNGDVEFSLLTNRDGLTETVRLPTPAKIYSESAFPKEAPYAVYDVEISKEGYLTKRVLGVPIFSSVRSLLPVNMIIADAGRPAGTIVTRSGENELLER